MSLAAGLVLGALATAAPLGLVQPYPKPPQAAIDAPMGLKQKITRVADLYRVDGEDMQLYLQRLTRTVSQGIVHYWHAGDAWAPSDVPHTRPALFANYLLWAHALHPGYQHFHQYEFMSPQYIVDRGYGFCSQVSKLIWSVLHEQGIRSEILNHPNHVVVQAEGAILDGAYGVFIPADAREIQSNPTMVSTYYADWRDVLPLLSRIYADGWESSADVQKNLVFMHAYERHMTRIKWFAPAGLLAFGLLSALASRQRLRGRSPGRSFMQARTAAVRSQG